MPKRITKVSWNKKALEKLSYADFSKAFSKVYGDKGVDLKAEYYAMFPEREPVEKKKKTEEERTEQG
jgi:hypothetical protein